MNFNLKLFILTTFTKDGSQTSSCLLQFIKSHLRFQSERNSEHNIIMACYYLCINKPNSP